MENNKHKNDVVNEQSELRTPLGNGIQNVNSQM
jgi:hypothetical protein